MIQRGLNERNIRVRWDVRGNNLPKMQPYCKYK